MVLAKHMLFDRIFRKRYPPLDWIQVEVSSYCNARCIYCPHEAYKKRWQNRILPVEGFQKLTPAFSRTKLVYLQGWGEPFTHPHFFEMLRLAKKAGCLVGTTTNGTLLTDEAIEKLISEQLDIIGFSLAGINERNDRIRRGTQIEKVLECIETVHRAKEKYGAHNPQVHIAYMLLRSGLNDLEKLPSFLGNIGASQMVISSLSLVVSPEMQTEAILASDKTAYSELKNRLLKVREVAATKGCDVHFHIVSSSLEESGCAENVTRAVVISSDGSISPCVMTQVPVEGKNFCYFQGRRQPLQKLGFGNIRDDSLHTIWQKRGYRRFIHTHARGHVPAICHNCSKRFIENLI